MLLKIWTWVEENSKINKGGGTLIRDQTVMSDIYKHRHAEKSFKRLPRLSEMSGN